MEAPLVLIASYPKSGNTWVRAVIQGLLTPDKAGEINQIDIGLYGHARRCLFDYYAPASAADMTPDEIELVLPSIWQNCAADAKQLTFIKVHDLARMTANGEWIFPPKVVRQVIYLVRHPFDVAVSYSNHLGTSIEDTVNILLGEHTNWFQAKSNLPLTLQETQGSWDENVRNWLDPALPYPVLCLRYEDLHRDDIGSFRKLASALGLPTDDRLDRAVSAARMSQLKAAEAKIGFRERPVSSPAFFRQGGSMTWEGLLTSEQRDIMSRSFSGEMSRLGYQQDGTTAITHKV